MIGWYVSVLVASSSSSVSFSNVNDIPFQDVGKPFIIQIADKIGRIHSGVGTTTPSYQEIKEKIYEYVQYFIGNGVNYLYTIPIKSTFAWSTTYSNELLLKIPSIKKSFPNSWVYAEGKTPVYALMYFKSLRKIVKYISGSNREISVANVGEDGSIGKYTSFPYYIFNMMYGLQEDGNGARIGMLMLTEYVDQSSLLKESNYKFGTLDYGPQERGGYSNTGVGIEVRPLKESETRVREFMEFMLGTEPNPPDINPDSPPDNPYQPDGPDGPGVPDSGEGGGDGNFDDKSDPIPDSSLPTLSSSNTGFTRIYNPTLSQVRDLAQYLWTDESVIQTIWNHIKQYFEDPMQAIIGFNLVPCRVPDGGTTTFKLMYIDTGVSMTAAASQFVDVDCGTLMVEKYYGSALDYSPYTKISCFLPYIGTVQLNTDEVMDSTLHVKYRIDICSGSCVAKILVNETVLYQYSGHCAIPIPFAAADFSSYVSAAISVAKLAVGAAAGGAMGAMTAADTNPSQQTNQVVTTTQVTDTARNPITGRQITTGTRTITETRESPADQSSTMASFSGLTPSNIANTVGQIMGSKPHVEHSGSFSGNTGYLGVRRPFLIIERPNMCMPAQYQQFNGFPSMITETFSNLKGFTKVQQVQLTGMTATNPEQAEILEFLKSGVII